MFKKLCLVLTIALLIGPIGGAAIASEEGQECRVPAGSKIFMMVNVQDSLPVMPNKDITVTLGMKITEPLVKLFTAKSTMYGLPMDWTGSRVATVSDGKIIVVREVDLKDCK